MESGGYCSVAGGRCLYLRQKAQRGHEQLCLRFPPSPARTPPSASTTTRAACFGGQADAKHLLYNIMYGPPIFAPLLFGAAGMLGILASLLRRRKG